jgi:hypothetical protein
MCALLSAPQFQAGVRHLHELEDLIVRFCAFVSMEAVLEMVNLLPSLLYGRWNDVVLLDDKGPHSVSRLGTALAARLQELAAFDERYCYSKKELLEVRSSESVPQLGKCGELAAMLDELELWLNKKFTR